MRIVLNGIFPINPAVPFHLREDRLPSSVETIVRLGRLFLGYIGTLSNPWYIPIILNPAQRGASPAVHMTAIYSY